MRGQDRQIFQGESQLMTALKFLEEGKEKPVIYFTQGNGEMDINDANSGDAPDVGAGVLKQRLEGDNYVVKGLAFSPVEGAKPPHPGLISSTKVPDDATFVAVVRPQRMPKYALDALDKYMKGGKDASRRGRLVVLLNPPSASQPDETELAEFEKWLAGFNVQVGQDRVLCLRRMPFLVDPLKVIRVTTNPELTGRNPIAAAFANHPFLFDDVRTVDPVTTGISPDSRYQGQTLLQANPEDKIWAETNLRLSARQFLEDENLLTELPKKISATPLSLGVVVMESTSTDPHARMMGQAEDKPCLAVYGNANFVGNMFLTNEGPIGHPYDLFASTLGWLRERQPDIGIQPKKQDVYFLNTANRSHLRMALVPLFYMVVCILGLGTGIWVVRRR